jgi:hypothetical protein
MFVVLFAALPQVATPVTASGNLRSIRHNKLPTLIGNYNTQSSKIIFHTNLITRHEKPVRYGSHFWDVMQ